MKRISVNSKIIIGMLCCVLLVGFFGWMTTGFTDFTKDSVVDKFSAEVNPKNIYHPEDCILKSQNLGDGLAVTVDKDGSISIKGQNESKTDDVVYTVGTVTLDKGIYTFTALDGGSKSKAYVTLSRTVGSETTVINADFTGNTFEVTSDGTTWTIQIVIRPECSINATVYPVIVAGEEAGNYYK